ncbi:MAG: nucleoside deaminase [Lentisphaerae bacterium]|nr:nucleoside deaminase [Lentisphaerota bacterium]
MKRWPDAVVGLPDWAAAYVETLPDGLADDTARMGAAIGLARLNVEYGTGGPFGAAVFEQATGRLIAPGVNAVLASRNSAAHAEMMALMLAQRVLGTHDLGGAQGNGYALVSSTEPCAMCLGALPWSGIRRLVCGAREADARAVGFDEGDKPADWAGALARRGITVVRDIRREEAAAVLRLYRERGGTLY